MNSSDDFDCLHHFLVLVYNYNYLLENKYFADTFRPQSSSKRALFLNSNSPGISLKYQFDKT